MWSQQIFTFEKTLNIPKAKAYLEHTFPDALNKFFYVARKICKLLQITLKSPFFEEFLKIIEQKHKIEKQMTLNAGTQRVFQER